MSDRRLDTRITFVNRLLGETECWANVSAMLNELCTTFGVRAAGLRWPADGPALVCEGTAQPSEPVKQIRFPVPGLAAGSLWIEAASDFDESSLCLAANAVGHSRLLRQRLGPIIEQARVAQRLEDAARVAGRVAHDLDNVFQGVTGFAALALDVLPSGSPAARTCAK